MKTKYFRFLYQGLNGCLMHRCELEDTAAQERFIFIYLSGTDETADQKDVGNTLFLCPETDGHGACCSCPLSCMYVRQKI